MKRIFFAILVIVILIITALVFDFGRKDVVAPVLNQVDTALVEIPIVVLYPKEGQNIESPLKISGKAKGSWFFEGSFPIQLVDTDGFVIASSLATSSSDWMTEDFIDFSSEIDFVKPTSTKNAILVFIKDNPSGISELDQSMFIPVVFK